MQRVPDDQQVQLLEALFALSVVPLPDGSRRKKLAGVKPPLYRLREGDWRFIYRIDGRTVRVLDLIRRRDLDDWLRRRR